VPDRLEEVDRVTRELDPALRSEVFLVLGGYVLDQLHGAMSSVCCNSC
jgi:hypothetical protein